MVEPLVFDDKVNETAISPQLPVRLNARRRWIRFSAVGIFIAITSLPQTGSAQVEPSLQFVESRIAASVQRFQTKTGVLVDPLIVHDMAKNALLFSGSMCYPTTPGAGQNCTATLGAPNVLDRIVTAHLTELANQRPATIESLASRLSKSVGLNIADAGWPTEADNDLAVVSLPRFADGTSIALQTATGRTVLGRNPVALLVRPGRHVLVLQSPDGQKSQQTIVATARNRVTAGAFSTTASAPLGRLQAPNLACSNQPQPVMGGPLMFFNWGRARFAEAETVRRANLTPFATQAAIDIRVTQEAGGSCGASCGSAIGIAFAQAIAVWRGACERCGGNMLAVVKVGSRVWLDSRAADRLRAYQVGRLAAVDLDLTRSVSGESQRIFASPSGAASVGYEQVDGDQDITKTTCALGGSEAPWAQPLKTALCSRTPAALGALRPVVALKNAETSCGPAGDFVACGTVGGGIELALAGIRYQLKTPTGSVVNVGQSDGELLDLLHVVVHEVGHWFGVPHAEVAREHAVLDLMSSTYAPGRACLSAASNIMLNNAADRRWSYRETGMQGLRRQKRTR